MVQSENRGAKKNRTMAGVMLYARSYCALAPFLPLCLQKQQANFPSWSWPQCLCMHGWSQQTAPEREAVSAASEDGGDRWQWWSVAAAGRGDLRLCTCASISAERHMCSPSLWVQGPSPRPQGSRASYSRLRPEAWDTVPKIGTQIWDLGPKLQTQNP